MAESADKTWSTVEGQGKSVQYSCLENLARIYLVAIENPMNYMKKQKDRTLKDELPRLVGAQYTAGED